MPKIDANTTTSPPVRRRTMEQSIEYGGLAAPRPRRWVRETPAGAETDGPKMAFKLLLLFLIVLYSNVALIYKLDAYRPALLIAIAAIVMMIVELAQLRQSF